jgi:hypothetical protein
MPVSLQSFVDSHQQMPSYADIFQDSFRNFVISAGDFIAAGGVDEMWERLGFSLAFRVGATYLAFQPYFSTLYPRTEQVGAQIHRRLQSLMGAIELMKITLDNTKLFLNQLRR